MEKLPANAGWLWIKRGFALFRKQPAELLTLFLAYMFVILMLSIVPMLGQILPILLIPLFAMTFMHACADIEQDKRIYPNLLLVGFQSPQLGRLIMLGALYLLAAIVSVGASALIDGGTFWQIMSGQKVLNQQTVNDSNLTLPMLFSAVVYIPAGMAFWYAAPLIAWRRMSLGKALFYSFFSVYRERKAFFAYGLSWTLIYTLQAFVISILAQLFSEGMVVMIVLLPLSIFMTVVMYCSFYPTFTQIFGPNEDTSPAPSA